jgi:hypothetical protein
MMIQFGPWSPDLNPVERRARFRALAAVTAAFARIDNPAVVALALAEADEKYSEDARKTFDAIPALTRRRIISVYEAARMISMATEKARYARRR